MQLVGLYLVYSEVITVECDIAFQGILLTLQVHSNDFNFVFRFWLACQELKGVKMSDLHDKVHEIYT